MKAEDRSESFEPAYRTSRRWNNKQSEHCNMDHNNTMV